MRPDWDTYFMEIAKTVSTRGNCSRRQVGAIVVVDHCIVTTGYNGTPRGITNCMDGGCERCSDNVKSGERLGDCICCHAEENAIAQAAYHGISVKGGTLYTNLSPCRWCARMIVNAGIVRVMFDLEYEDRKGTELLAQAKVRVTWGNKQGSSNG